MNLKELDSFKLSDAIKFHDRLNPKLWYNNRLRPEVKKQLKLIAEDFLTELGISGLDVEDLTVSGSNAAYTYTPHSDLDLHILIDMSKLPHDEVYRELFNAKKTIYNDSHNIKVHGVPIELYVQDTNEPVISLGEYSLLNDRWIKIPSKRRANFDQTTTKAKYDKLYTLVTYALKSKNLSMVKNVIKKIKQYRQAGLDKGGEFSPENLAYKALRNQNYITKLYDLRDKLHSKDLSIENMYAQEDYHPNAKPPGPEFKPTMPAGTVRVDVSDVYDWYKLGQHISNLKGLGHHDFGQGPPSTIMAFGSEPEEHKYIKDLEKTGLTTTDIDPVDKNQPKGMKRQKVDPTFNVNEIVHPDVTSDEYFIDPTENVRMGDFEFNARTFTGALGDQNARGLQIRAYDPKLPKDSGSIGSADFIVKSDKKGNQWLESDDTEVNEKYRGKGVAAMMYAFAKSLGNDIKDSPYKSKAGGDMWRKWGKDAKHLVGEEEKPKQGAKSAIYSTDVYGMTAYHSKCLEPGCDWESKRYDSIKLAQNAAQKHAQKHFKSIDKKGVAEGQSSEQAISLSRLGKFHKGSDPLEQFVPERAGAHYALHPDKWQATFYSLTNKDPEKLKYYGPEKVTIPPGTLVGDMAIANKFYRAKTPEEKQLYAEQYRASLQPYPVDISKYRMPELLIPRQNVAEASGYIPSEKEKNDPRFKTALTVDVKPDSIKKNAKAFYSKVSRAGIPPTLNPSGKF